MVHHLTLRDNTSLRVFVERDCGYAFYRVYMRTMANRICLKVALC